MSFMDDMFSNNGMTVTYFENLKVGDKLVLVEDSNEFSEPYQIIIKSVREETVASTYDCNEFDKVLIITDNGGDEYLIDITLMTPNLKGYEMYPNFKHYFELKQIEIDKLVEKLKRNAKYVSDYRAYKKELIKTSPEKVI